MAKSSTQEGWHKLDDGEQIYIKTWKPSGEAKARLVFVHGFSDHWDSAGRLLVSTELRLYRTPSGNAYGPFFPLLAERSIEVFAFDQRGWGRSVKSPKQKGLSGPTSQVLDDISSILDRFIPSSTQSSPQSINLPIFLMGHSMGGAEILHHATSTNPRHTVQHAHIRGLLAESPWVALHPSTAPWRITVIGGRIASKLMPKMHMVNPVNVKLLSRDQDVVARLRDDELCHDTGTLEGLAGMLDRAAALDSGELRLTDEDGRARSLFITHGTEDGICSFDATERWVKNSCRVTDTTWKAYDGWYHRLHDEIGDCKITYANDIADWIKARC